VTRSALRNRPLRPFALAEPVGDRGRRPRRLRAALGRPVTAARISVLLGLLCLIDAITPTSRASVPVVPFWSPEASATTRATVAVAGVVLWRIAAGLRRRKRSAWRIAALVGVVVTVADVVRPDWRPAEASMTVLLLASLVVGRRHFGARADPRSRRAALRIAAEALVAGCGFGMVTLSWGSHTPPRVSWVARLEETLRSLVGLGGGIPLHGDSFADVFHATLLLWGLVAIVAVAVVLLRSPGPLQGLGPDDERRLRQLLDAHGDRDSLGYFALRPDKSIVWSPSRKAAITYRVVCGVALISGDPLGDREAWPGAIAAFRDLMTRYGWTPAAMGCSETGATVLRRELGLNVLELGDEAVVEVARYSLDGRAMRGVRQACTRVARAGYVVEVRRIAELTDDELAELRTCADSWRRDAVERGFSMALSRLGGCGDDGCIVVTARRDGRLRGFPAFRPVGPSRDVARPDASRPGLGQRPQRVHDHAAAAVLSVPRDRAGVAELRGLPRRPGPGWSAGRGSRDPVVAATAVGRVPLVADRVPLPVQREVPARVVPALSLLPGVARHPPGRCGRARGRSVRRPPTPASARSVTCGLCAA
jgi:lysyl-tRNA synthetase class 2